MPPAVDALIDPRGAGVVTLATPDVFAAETLLFILPDVAADAAAVDVSAAGATTVAAAFTAAAAAPLVSGDAA